MNSNVFTALINNAVLLISIVFIFDTILIFSKNNKSIFTKIIVGVVIGIIGIVAMMTHWSFSNGIMFDTRSVLLSMSGLFFGSIPTIVAMLIISIFRIYQGGGKVILTGISVIFSSGILGICANHYLRCELLLTEVRSFYLRFPPV